MKNILVLAGLILAVTNVQAQELPAGLSSKCECSSVDTTYLSNYSVELPSGLYLQRVVEIKAWISKNRFQVSIPTDAWVISLPIVRVEAYVPGRKEVNPPALRIDFVDSSYALIWPPSENENKGWSKIGLYRAPAPGESCGTLYLQLNQ
jgi:hypothetical protein